MHGGTIATDWVTLLWLLLIGAVASGINSVAGGGSLISFPLLTGLRIGSSEIGFKLPLKEANATNSVGLWPGSLAGAFGFWNLIPKTGHYFRTFWLPTVIGSTAGALLLIYTSQKLFGEVVPVLLLGAAALLALQPRIRKWAAAHKHQISKPNAILLHFLVSLYGGYFGAGMGIMMLAVFTLYMEGNIHEINAVKNWLAVIINLVASSVFIVKGLVLIVPGITLAIGAIIGGFLTARWSQKVNPDKLRVAIAVYGVVMAGYFAYQSWF